METGGRGSTKSPSSSVQAVLHSRPLDNVTGITAAPKAAEINQLATELKLVGWEVRGRARVSKPLGRISSSLCFRLPRGRPAARRSCCALLLELQVFIEADPIKRLLVNNTRRGLLKVVLDKRPNPLPRLRIEKSA
jgi:hypothetical protein